MESQSKHRVELEDRRNADNVKHTRLEVAYSVSSQV